MNKAQFNRMNEAWNEYAMEDAEVLERVAFLNGYMAARNGVDEMSKALQELIDSAGAVLELVTKELGEDWNEHTVTRLDIALQRFTQAREEMERDDG